MAAPTPSSARICAPNSAAASSIKRELVAVLIAEASEATVRFFLSMEAGPKPRSWTRFAQNAGRRKKGHLTVGLPARNDAPVVPAPP